jgi:hypothetical protein
MRNAFSYIQRKIAMARMQDANVAASEITERVALPTPIGCADRRHRNRRQQSTRSRPRATQKRANASRKMYGGVNASRTLGSCTAA